MRNDANNSSQSFVSIIIPCRNERKYIGPCLDCVLAQDYPREAMEVLVVDGVSSDGTREVLERYSAKHTFIRILDNPQKITPCALNIGIKRSRGDIIIRLDAHAYYPPEYVSRCVKHLNEFKVDNVGGVWITLPGADTIQAKAIAIVLASNFGVGNSLFRIGGLTEPTLVDTVPFGCFKRKVFDEIGLFDEDLIRNQDDEFNARLIKHGGKVLLIPEIWSEYYARATLAQLWRMYYQYGYFKPLASIKLGKVTTWRQLVPAFFIVSLIALSVAMSIHPLLRLLWMIEFFTYISAVLVVSTALAFRHGIGSLPYLIVSFLAIHFGHGLGYLKGVMDFSFLKKHLKGRIPDMPLTR